MPLRHFRTRMSGSCSQPDVSYTYHEGPLRVRTGGSGRGERQPRPTELDARLEQSSPQLQKCGQVPTTPIHHRRKCQSMASADQCDGANSGGQVNQTGPVGRGAPNRLRHVDGLRHRVHGFPIAKSRGLSKSGSRMAPRSLKRSSPLIVRRSCGQTPRLESSCRIAACP